jgi:hydrogenase/urease accessory protein HupE
MPDMATSSQYLSGFIVTTILLHILGLIIGHYTRQLKRGSAILKAIGLAIAALGFIF